MIVTTWTCRAGANKVKENRRASEGNSVRGHAARKHRKTLGDLEQGPWLGQTSTLVVDDQSRMRGFRLRTLEPFRKPTRKRPISKARRASLMLVCITLARRTGVQPASV